MNSNPENSSFRLHGEEMSYTPEMIQEFIKCKEDVIYFAEKYVNIITLDRGKEIIKLWDHQKELLRVMENPPEGKRHLCILSSRQSAKTTTCIIFMLHYALFNEDKTVAILANKEATAIDILKRVKLAYENIPRWLQQGISRGGWNKKTIEFENGSKIRAASTSSSALRGISANIVLLDEFAFVPDNLASEFMSSVYPIIVQGTTTKIIIVSTSNGMNFFHDIYRASVAGENNYHPVTINWRAVPGRDDAWKDNVIRDIGLMRWMQEFECKFLGSTATLVDGTKIEAMVKKEPIEVLRDGCLLVYEKPVKGAVYILGVDPGKGLGQDYSTMQILRVDGVEDLEQVAIYRNNKIDPHNFAGVVVEISVMYNNGFLLVENNGKEGGMVIEAIHYVHQYEQLICLSPTELGITSNVKVKFTANMLMRRYVENNFIKIHDKTTIIELGKYEEVKPNIFKAKDKSDHDDCVTALIWAVYFVELIDIIGLSFDEKTRAIINGDFSSTNYNGSDIPVAVIDDGTEMFDYQFVDEDGVVWR
jgi:hypothetical protein